MLTRFRAAVAPVLLPLALFGVAACDDGDDDDTAGDTAGDTAAADTHAEHGADHGEEGADPDTMVEWIDMPPATIAAGTPVEATFMVHTEGELHIAELRACEGAAVADCGLGDMDSFVIGNATEGDPHMYSASITLDAGTWTVVAYSHVGPDPFRSEPVQVTVE